MEVVCVEVVMVRQVTGSFFIECMCFDVFVEGEVTGSSFMDLLCFDLVVEGQATRPFFIGYGVVLHGICVLRPRRSEAGYGVVRY